MRISTLMLCTLIGVTTSLAWTPQVVRTTTDIPQVSTPVVNKPAVKQRAPRIVVNDDAALQAALSVQGASSQKQTWSENFDAGMDNWSVKPDEDGNITWQLTQTTGTNAFSTIDPSDVQSLKVEGPYQVYKRAISSVASSDIAIPANGVLHAYVGYSQNMNDYASLKLEVSADNFATATEVWNSLNETGTISWRWHELAIDMNQFAGQNVRLRFTYGPGSKDTFGTGGYMADFTIDGLSVTGVSDIDHIDVTTGEVVTFVDLSTGTPSQWSWTFEGGTPATSTSPSPQVYYKVDGSYDVTLTVTDSAGNTSTVTRSDFVRVTGTAPVAHIIPPATFRFDDTHLPMVAPLLPVQFRDGSSGFPTQWNWAMTGTTPATSTDENPMVRYDFRHEQGVTLDVANEHGTSHDSISVSVEYEGYINNLLATDYPTTFDLEGYGTFPGSNKMKITEYGEYFSAPSRPMLVYGALVFFESATAEALTDQIADVGVHLYTAKDGLPDERVESMWWRVFELGVSTATTLRGTWFEFSPKWVNDDFFIVVDGIPESNDSCNVSFAMASLRDHDNTAFMKTKGQWRPVAGYFDATKSCTSFYIYPLVAHSVISLLPVGTEEITVGAAAGTVDQEIFSIFGYKEPIESDADWCRVTSTANGLTLDTLAIAYDALPDGIDSRTATLTMTDGYDTITLRVIQVRGDEPQPLVGDVNLDGKVDAADIACIVNIITGVNPAGTYGTRDDVNSDGSVNAGDIAALVTLITSE